MTYLLQYIIYFTVLLFVVFITSRILKIEPENNKYVAFDGVRGICASLVAIYHLFWRDGNSDAEHWSLDYIQSKVAVHFILLTGEISVGIFFIISAFLFFRKALQDNFDYERFFTSRILRIYPPVIFSIIIIYFASYIISANHSYQINDLIETIPSLFNYPMTRINDTSLIIMNSGVFWTMVWELRLYIAIPLLYILIKQYPYPKTIIISSMAYIMYVWYFVNHDNGLSYTMYFLAGFMVASIQKEYTVNSIIGLLTLIFAIFLIDKAYNVTTPLIMMAVFFTIKCGCTYFGLLTSMPLRILGTCSFSIYLLQGIPQAVSKHYLYSNGGMAWKIVAIASLGVMAPLMYKYIEKPAMNASFFSKKTKVV